MTFNDIFKSSFLENVTAVPLTDMAVALALSFFLGLFIFFVYKKTYSGVMFSQTFGGALIAMTMITTMVILAVTSNVVLSLGMVGALSIVRFRTAIKEPMDIAFLFWAIAAGRVKPYIAVITCADADTEKKASEYLRKSVSRAVLKSESVQSGAIEMSYEVLLKDESSRFIVELSKLAGVNSAVLVSYNGDYLS